MWIHSDCSNNYYVSVCYFFACYFFACYFFACFYLLVIVCLYLFVLLLFELLLVFCEQFFSFAFVHITNSTPGNWWRNPNVQAIDEVLLDVFGYCRVCWEGILRDYVDRVCWEGALRGRIDRVYWEGVLIGCIERVCCYHPLTTSKQAWGQ